MASRGAARKAVTGRLVIDDDRPRRGGRSELERAREVLPAGPLDF
jgi:hypothetical protein